MMLSLDRIIAELPLEDAFGVFSRLASQIESGFTRGDAEQLHASIAALSEDEDVLVEPWVEIQGARVPLIVEASRTADGFEVCFMSAPPLSALIEEAVTSCQGARSVKVLRAMGEA